MPYWCMYPPYYYPPVWPPYAAHQQLPDAERLSPYKMNPYDAFHQPANPFESSFHKQMPPYNPYAYPPMMQHQQHQQAPYPGAEHFYAPYGPYAPP